MALTRNQIVGGGLATGLGVLALNNTAGVSASINAFSALATGITTGTKTLVANILGTTGAAKVGALAPFAAPVVGGLVGYKVAGALGVESRLGKTVAGLVPGAAAGAAALGTGALAGTFAPLLLGVGGAYAVYKGAGWTWGKLRRQSA